MNRQDISDLMIERYVLDELPEGAKQKIDALRREDTELDERISRIYSENEIFFKEHPADLFVEQIIKRAEEEKRSSQIFREKPFTLQEVLNRIKNGFNARNLVSAVAAAAVLVLVIMYTPFDSGRLRNPVLQQEEGIRIKGGGASLMIYRKTNSGTALLGDGSRVEAGDLLQLSYRSGFPYGAIVSIDGNGLVTKHLPLDSTKAVELEQDPKVALPNSIMLDDAPEYERFYFFVSEKTFSVDYVIEQIKDADASKDIRLKNDSIKYSVVTLYK